MHKNELLSFQQKRNLAKSKIKILKKDLLSIIHKTKN